MPGWLATLPAPELPRGRRFALVASTETYADPSLRRLRAPARDADEMRQVLADADIGGFTVASVTDRTAQQLRLALAEFVLDRQPDDLLLLYLSCHGLVDLRRRLYFAATDTRKDRLAATGVEASWVLEQLDDCRARRQVVVLDCCFSGAFAQGTKGDSDLGLGERFHGQGRGRVVLTASRGTEYSFEGEPVAGSSMPGSVFTSALVAGLRTGAADLDRDGYVSVDDAYAYAYDRVCGSGAEQTPQRWAYGAEGSIVLARNPAGIAVTPAPLPEALRSALDAAQPSIRLGAVQALGDWLADPDPARALGARQALSQVAESDIPEVAGPARAALERSPAGPPTYPDPHAAPTPEPPAARRGSPLRRGPATVLAALTFLVAAGVGAALLLDDAETPDPSTGDFVTDGAWRLLVRDTVSLDDGCAVTLTHTDTGKQFRRDQIYNSETVQIPLGGTFDSEVSHQGCELVEQDGSGDVRLPFEWECCIGDTDSFAAPAQVGIEVVDFNGNSECGFELHDAEDGTVVHVGDTRASDTLVLDPGTAERVYLADLMCTVRVFAQ
jgi:uncharacterized caspase-like protein